MTSTFHFSDALQLLAIGMLTVFLILFLVVLIGNTIVRFVNRFLPEAKVIRSEKAKTSAIDPRKMAAIVAAVQTVTGGRSKIEKVEKL